MENLDLNSFKNRVLYKKVLTSRNGIYDEFPNKMSNELIEFLKKQEIDKLYCHQSEMFEKVIDKKNVVITTSTASGKTMSFLLPIIQKILQDPTLRAIIIYPTKALANDQYRNLKPFLDYFGKRRIQAGIYDGDTPSNERTRIRKNANIILTNPEMLNSSFLPNHSKYGFNYIFSRLAFVVIDELHIYRGAFGSHMANIISRLNRVSKFYGSQPQYLLSSATIANPIELAEKIIGQKVEHISKDGSPAGEKEILIWLPPTIKDTDRRKGIIEEASNFIPEIINQNKQFIAFCKSRVAVEVIVKEVRDAMRNVDNIPDIKKDTSQFIAGYRGGYTAKERQETEEKLTSGILSGVVSTNALELGIDIGKIDVVVSVGFPGTKASFWQQIGRAGRSGKKSFGILILDNGPTDNYIGFNQEWLFTSSIENAVVDKHNLLVQLAHVRAAAAEMPLTLDDIGLFPDLGEIVPVLIKAGELKSQGGRFSWSGNEYPAGDYSLRTIDNKVYKVINSSNDEFITEFDESTAFRESFPNAIYMHDGTQYLVEKLDLNNLNALVKPINVNYYTAPISITEIKIINERINSEVKRTKVTFGDVNVNKLIVAFKKVQFYNHSVLGSEKIDMPLSKEIETEAMWYLLPDEVVEKFGQILLTEFNYEKTYTYYDGITFSILHSTMMRTMSTKQEVDGAYFLKAHEDKKAVNIIIYDTYPGGLGYSEKAYEFSMEIVEDAISMVKGCPCKDGCPACVGDFRLDKKVVLWGLKTLLSETEFQSSTKQIETPKVFIEDRIFELSQLSDKWEEFLNYLSTKGSLQMVPFFKAIKVVDVINSELFFTVDTPFYKEWILDDNNKKIIKNIILQYTVVLEDFDIKVKISDYSKEKEDKIMHRYEDLRKG